MISAILGELWPYIAGAIGIASVFLFGRSNGKKTERLKMERADSQNASKIRERVDDTLRKHDGDTRPVDDRLRDKGRLRD